MTVRLNDLLGAVNQLDAALGSLDATVTTLKTVINTGTQPKAEDIGALPSILGDQTDTVGKKAAALPLVPAELIAVFRGVNINRDLVAKGATATAAEVPKLGTAAEKTKGLLENLPPSDVVSIAILGQNLDSVSKIEASVKRDVLDWAQPKVDSGNGVRTVITKDSILLYVRASRSATIHFRLTFTRKDPKNPAVTIERRLYTPPIVLTYSTSSPAFSGGGYFTLNAPPAPLMEDEPANLPAKAIPVDQGRKRLAVQPVRSRKASAVDFTEDLFPPLPEK